MSLSPPDHHSVYEEWLHLELDDGLDAGEKRLLEQHLRQCRVCRGERLAIAELHRALERSRVPVVPEFAERVMETLPQAGWEAKSKAGWRFAALVFVILAVLSGVIAIGGGRPLDQPLGGTAAALVELFGSALVAGGGLLGASWRGVALAIGDIFRGSPAAMIVFGAFVLGLDVLFVRYLMRSGALVGSRRPERESDF